MNRALLIQKLEDLAKVTFPWNLNGEYVLAFADLRELLEEAAKQLKQPA